MRNFKRQDIQDAAFVAGAIIIVLLALAFLPRQVRGAEPTTAEGYLERAAQRIDNSLAEASKAQQDVEAARQLLVKPDPDPEPDPDDPPPPPPGQTRNVYGDFILQPLFHSDNDRTPPRGDRLVDESELRKPGVDGLTIRIIPTYLSRNGQWDFSFVDACVQRCRNTGDRYTLLLAAGGSNPLAEDKLKFYESAAAALGGRYAADPLCVGAHVAGSAPQGHSEELFWGRPMPANAKAATKRMIDAWTAAFPLQVKLLAGSANDPAAMRELIDYGIAKTGGRFLYKNNAMKASTVLNWEGNQLVVWAAKNGAMPGWEFVGSWTLERSRFGSPFSKAYENMDALCDQAGWPRRQTYRAVYPPDIELLKDIR